MHLVGKSYVEEFAADGARIRLSPSLDGESWWLVVDCDDRHVEIRFVSDDAVSAWIEADRWGDLPEAVNK